MNDFRRRSIGVELLADLAVGKRLGHAEEPVASVAYNHVNLAKMIESLADHVANGGGISDVEGSYPEPVRIALPKVIKLADAVEAIKRYQDHMSSGKIIITPNKHD